MPATIPDGKPRSAQISQDLDSPPPRPAEAPEPAVSDLDSLLNPASKAPEPASEPSPKPEIKAEEPEKKEEPKPKSLKDDEFDKFIAGTEPKKEEAKETKEAPELPATEFKTPKALREAYELTKAEKARLAEELEAFKKAQADSKAILSELEQVKKQNAEMEDTFRVHKYENSREYKEKFLAPMEKLYANAVTTLAELEVADPEKGSRPATPNDLEAIVRLPVGKAIAAAKELFGDAAPIVLSYREQIKSLHQQSVEARESHKTRWQELEQKHKAESLTKQEELRSMWNKANQELTEKYAEVFADSKDDEEGNKLLASGRKLADIALMSLDGDNVPPDQRIKVVAEIRNRAAAFGREVVRRRKAEAKITELEEQLKAFKSSAPDKGSTRATKPSTEQEPNSLADALNKLGSLA